MTEHTVTLTDSYGTTYVRTYANGLTLAESVADLIDLVTFDGTTDVVRVVGHSGPGPVQA